jgi:hypothetical protein
MDLNFSFDAVLVDTSGRWIHRFKVSNPPPKDYGFPISDTCPPEYRRFRYVGYTRGEFFYEEVVD